MLQNSEVVKSAELGVIGSALNDPGGTLPRAIEAGVMPDWFSEARWQVVWTACLDEFGVSKSLSDGGGFSMAVLDRARKIAARARKKEEQLDISIADFESAISSFTTSAYIENHFDILRSEVMMRRLAKAQDAFHRNLEDGLQVSDAIAGLNSRITSILASAMGAKTTPPGEVLDKILEEYREAHRIRIDEKRLDYTPGIPLPWRDVNLKANGIQEGLYYIGARPSVGKTAFVLNFVRFWCERGIKVGFNSLDMALKQLLKRPLGEVSRVSFNKASFGTTTAEDLKAMEAAAAKIREWPLEMIDFRDVDKLRAWAVALHAAGKLEVLIVDFVQLLRARQRFSNSEERIEYVSGVLKSIAVDLSMPVIALSQLNRECEKDGGRVPTSSDLRGSGALEQDAFAIFMLHRDKEVKAKWESNPPLGLTPSRSAVEFKGIDPVRFIIAKNQNGQAGPEVWFPFVFFKKYCAIMLGDWQAQPIITTSGHGVTAHETRDYSPLYEKVHSDWRHDSIEESLRLHGTLIDDEGAAPEDTSAAPPAPQPEPVQYDDEDEEDDERY